MPGKKLLIGGVFTSLVSPPNMNPVGNMVVDLEKLRHNPKDKMGECMY